MTAWRLADNTALPGGWRLLRLEHPEYPAGMGPGHRLALSAAGRPYTAPVMDTSPKENWVACLLPAEPDEPVARLRRGAELDATPSGEAVSLPGADQPVVVIGQGLGIGPALFLARLVGAGRTPPLVLLETDTAFPFRHRPSQFVVPGLPPDAIATAPMLETAGIPARLAHAAGLPGCFEGTVVELFECWRKATSPDDQTVYAFGPDALADALRSLAPDLRFSEIS